MRWRAVWVLPVVIAVALGAVVFFVGRGDSPPPRRSVGDVTCPSRPAARTAVAERAGFSEGASIGGRNADALQREIAGIAATGARYLRFDFDWSHIGRDPGVLDWTVADRIVDMARSCTLDVLGVLAYTPAWARAEGTSDHHPPSDAGTFAAFARAAVERYGPRGVRTWEVWNEPNLGGFWSPKPDPASYATLLVATYDAVKAVDPGATVVTGGLSPASNAADGSSTAPVTFLEGVYRAGGGDHFDAVGHHPSHYPFLPLHAVDDYNDNAFAGVTPRLHDVMTARGDGDKQIWGTEMGAPTVPGNSVAYLADYLTEAYEAWNRWSYTGPLIWYSYLDAGTDPNNLEDNFGLVRADFTAKEPALERFKDVMRVR
jgi:polysaccharide biosynthesis protein PslG